MDPTTVDATGTDHRLVGHKPQVHVAPDAAHMGLDSTYFHRRRPFASVLCSIRFEDSVHDVVYPEPGAYRGPSG